MKIIQLIPLMRRAGAESVVSMLSYSLADAGHEVHLIVIGGINEYESDLKGKNVKVHILNLFYDNLRFFQFIRRSKIKWNLFKLIKEIKPDILHAHLSDSLVWAAFSIKKLKIKTFYTNHGLDTMLSDRGLRNWWLRRNFIRSVKITKCHLLAVSNSVARYIEDNLDLLRGSVLVQNNLIDLKRFYPLVRNNEKKKIIEILMIGTLYPLKKFDVGIKAMEFLKEIDNLILIIIGDGPERQDLERIANLSCCSERIEFLGIRKDVPDLLRNAFAVWLLSEREGMPMTVLEAMASGVPVIATDVPGINELVQNEVNGLIVPINDSQTVAEKTKRIIIDAQLRNNLIKCGLETAKKYSLEIILNQHIKLYMSGKMKNI